MDSDKTVSIMQQLGFTANEAKAYLGLLACQPASAYEVARESSIPTSKIYETINKLIARGVVLPVRDVETSSSRSTDKNRREYAALNPADFLNQIKETTISHTDELKPLLERADESTSGDFIWPLQNQGQIATKAHQIIGQAREYILLSCWPDELAWLAEDLRKAETLGIKIALVHFGMPETAIGATYHHPVERTLYNEKGGRGLTLVADETVLIANYGKNGNVEAAWSRNHAFVTVAEDYIKHDVYITKVTRFLNREMLQRFGDEYERLRDVFNSEA